MAITAEGQTFLHLNLQECSNSSTSRFLFKRKRHQVTKPRNKDSGESNDSRKYQEYLVGIPVITASNGKDKKLRVTENQQVYLFRRRENGTDLELLTVHTGMQQQ